MTASNFFLKAALRGTIVLYTRKGELSSPLKMANVLEKGALYLKGTGELKEHHFLKGRLRMFKGFPQKDREP